MRLSSWMRLALGAALVVAAVTLAGAAPAIAGTAPPPPTSDPFYSYSGSLSAVAPGTVLRSRSVNVAENGSATPIKATQLLYRTTGEQGQATATVATIIRPAVPIGTTKLVSYQTAYDALGSECDPSYTLQGGNSGYTTAQQEEQILLGYVAAGDTVVVPDYEGERLDWAAGQESGYGTLDGIRAAERFLNLPASSTPVGMVGYSGGSIATEFASELAPTYAPALHVVGTAEGGIPVDFFHNLKYINGSSDWSGVIPAVLVSLTRAFNVNLAPFLSPYGRQVTGQVQDECINNFIGSYPGLTYQQLLAPEYQNIYGIPIFVRITNHLIMGRTGTPNGPLFIGVGNADGTGDGVMVAADDEALAHTYCQRGVSVQFNEYKGDDHDQAAVPFEAGALTFLTQRLNGQSVANGCGSIGPGNSLAPMPVPQAGPGAPRLHLRYLGQDKHRHGIKVELWATAGSFRGLVVTLSRRGRSLGKRRLAKLTSHKRVLVLHARGHMPRRGRYKLRVTDAGHALLTRGIKVG